MWGVLDILYIAEITVSNVRVDSSLVFSEVAHRLCILTVSLIMWNRLLFMQNIYRFYNCHLGSDIIIPRKHILAQQNRDWGVMIIYIPKKQAVDAEPNTTYYV